MRTTISLRSVAAATPNCTNAISTALTTSVSLPVLASPPRVLSGKSLRKLTLETEKAIYDAFESGVSPGQLAVTYSVSRYSIYEAVKRYKKLSLGQ